MFAVGARSPHFPISSERQLYGALGFNVELARPDWFSELFQQGLVAFLNKNHEQALQDSYGEDEGARSDGICLTPAGIYYCASRPHLFVEQIHGLTADLNEDHVDGIVHLHSHFSPSDFSVPAAFGSVSIDHNSKAFRDTVEAIGATYDALASDNEIGANFAERDRYLEELQGIRTALENGNVSPSWLAVTGWTVLGFLASQFAEKPVGFLAENAWQLLKNLIGL